MPDRATTQRGLRVLFAQYANPGAYPPLEHAGTILGREGVDVRYLGIGTRGGRDLLFPDSLQSTVERRRFVEPGPAQKVDYVNFLRLVLRRVHEYRPNWVYLSDVFSTPLVPLIRQRGTEVVYHEHDIPRLVRKNLFESLLRRFRHQAIRQADLIVCPNASRLNLMLSSAECQTREDAYCVWNCPRTEEVDDSIPPGRSERHTDSLALYYHGSINPDRLPITLLDALTQLPAQVTLTIGGYAAGSEHVNHLREAAKSLGLQNRVALMEPVARRRELLLNSSQFDVGLCFYSPGHDINHKHMVGASNKPFDYLARGLALLVSDLSDWRELWGQHGFVRFANQDETPSLVESIRWFLEHRTALSNARSEGPRLIQQSLNYESQFAPVLRRLLRTPGDRKSGLTS